FNLTLAILNFAMWGNVTFGILNATVAVAGFIFTGDLLQRRAISRRKHIIEARYRNANKRPREVEPTFNRTSGDERDFVGQDAA
ncbi:MAG: hypothetical protein ACRD5H_05555, partial [Nitrososphaerales archaeon]